MKSFRLLLPNTDAASAREIGEAVRATVQALGLPHPLRATNASR